MAFNWFRKEKEKKPDETADPVEVMGFYEGDSFEAAQIRNLSHGDEVVLRDETGRPFWAGRGRGQASSADG